jgi:Tol biopolymer transport system component
VAANPPHGGVSRALAVAVGAVLLGVGTGVIVVLRNDGDPVAGPQPASSGPSPMVTTPGPSSTPAPSHTPTPSRTPDPWSSLPASAPLQENVIVWPRMRNGNWDVARLDLKTSKQKRLTTSAAIEWGPVISRNRRTIIYTRDTGDRPELRVMAANGTRDRPLFDHPLRGCFRPSRPAAALDGQLVVTCNTRAAQKMVRLLVVTLDGRIVRQLDQGRIGDPTVTPDGGSVLYWRNRNGRQEGGALYRIPIDGSRSRIQLTRGGDGEDADPVVSRDGRQLAFSRGTGSSRILMIAPFDGKNLIADPRPATRGNNDQDPSWSPDGEQIVYKRGRGDNADLWVLTVARRQSRPVMDDSGEDTVPTWTPR